VVTLGLGLVLVSVLLGPVLVGPIERNIEIFFLAAGTLAALIAGQFGPSLIHASLTEPIALTLAVLGFGAIARALKPVLDCTASNITSIASARWIYFTVIVVLGLLSSVITAVIAALVLVEIIALLGLDRGSEIVAVVLGCFAIGLGAALTPLGEPLSTIAVAALHVDFWYLVRLLGPLVIGGILLLGAISLTVPAERGDSLRARRDGEGWNDVVLRAAKVYVFVVGLVGLSWGLRPLVDAYVTKLPQSVLFWLNSVSAVVDNATLTAAEIGPKLSAAQQRGVLMGLLISGGILIPGNIPNIVAAGRLGISSREWARVGLVTGIPLMLLFFIVLHWI
jgi:predicted cation transporter